MARLTLWLLIFSLSAAAPELARAQSGSAAPPVLSGDLTDAEFQALLARLSDEQVRDILIRELAAKRAAASSGEGGGGVLGAARGVGEELSANATALLSKWPQLGDAFRAAAARLEAAGGLGFAMLALIASCAAGFAARYLWRRGASRRQTRLAERNAAKGAYANLGVIADAAAFVLIDLSSVAVFALAAMTALYVFFGEPDLRHFASSYIAVVAVVLAARSILDLTFPHNWPMYRLAAISDRATRILHGAAITLAGLWVFSSATAELMVRFDAPEGTPELLELILSALWAAIALGGVQLLHRETRDLLPPREAPGVFNALTRGWAGLLSAVVLAVWGLFVGGGLLAGQSAAAGAANLTLLMVMFGFWAVYRILTHYLRAQDLASAVKAAIQRTARAGLIAVGAIISLAVWGLHPEALEAGGLAGRWLQAAINVGLTALLGWAVWDLTRTIIDARIAAEAPAGAADEQAEGEGGLGASRSATLLPLLRSFAVAAIGLTCFFTAASSLGVNVAPLIAGAGVVGLAIGFGAQTLVKDIVSGVFFLIDDAFRRGEYIDLGSVKGVVERISLRSLQLRHHLGAVHTIPFGEIAALTNYSRDWVIMKLPLRLTFDTDPQQVKKIVKRIGAELQEDALVGGDLLEPPKSQGVMQMEDSAMILRVKFKATPGKQFAIRRELLHRIRAAFEAEGIRFASREVTVRVSETAAPAERLEAAGAAARRALETEQPA